MKKEIAVAMFVIIVGGLFAKYKIFDDKSELKYSLSQKIDSDFLTNKEEFGIQQLTLKNSGDLVINDIVIKINSRIIESKIKKFSNKDSVTTLNSNSNFEINYSKIPPTGELIILVKSGGINYENVEIYHSKGKATEVFENNSSNKSYVFYTLIIFYIIFSLISLRTIYTYLIESELLYDSAKILKKKKPWYIGGSKWSDIRSMAVKNYFKNDFLSKIDNTSYFKFLNKKEDENLTVDEKSKLNEIALSLFTNKIGDILHNSYFSSDVTILKSLKRPLNISIEKWEEILKKISKISMAKILRDLFASDLNIYNDSNVIKLLENTKPELLTDDDWGMLKDILNNYYLAIVLTDIVKYGDFSGKVKWEIINDKNIKKLKDILDKIKKSDESIEYYSELLRFLRASFKWHEIPEKPELFLDEDWSRIQELFEDVIQSKIDAETDVRDALQIKGEFYPLKIKVSKQLDIINDVLNDPTSIDKVECYNIPFEVGNWQNLIKLSAMLKTDHKQNVT